MEVGIRVEAENIQNRTVRHTNSCYFTMVAVDENRVPKVVPELVLVDDLAKMRYRGAEKRKQLRLDAQRLKDEKR